MATEYTDIKDLLRKTNNEEAQEEIESSGVPQDECLTAEEFTQKIVTPIIELQENAKKTVQAVKFNNVTYQPDENGVVAFNQMADSDTYAIKLASPAVSSQNIKLGSSLVINLRYMAIKATTLGDRSNYRDVAGTLVVSTRKQGATEWTDKYTMTSVVSQDENYDASAASSYNLSLDLTEYLVEGAQDVRIRVSSSYTDENGVNHDFHGDLTYSINAVNLVVKNLTDSAQPYLASEGGYPMSLAITGAVDKVLHVQITGALGTWEMTPKTFSASEQRPESNPYTWRQGEVSGYNILSHGVHTVTAWLTCEDGNGGELTSDKAVNRFMIINTDTATKEELTKPYLMLQSVQSVVENYVRTVISSFSVWKAKSADEPTVADTETVSVSVRITNAGDNDTDYTTAYFVYDLNAEVKKTYDIDTTIEIEASTTGESPASYMAYLRVFRTENGTLKNFLKESTGMKFITFTVDNSNDYSPVSGAHFYLNPKVRNNTEDSWQSIINQHDGSVVSSVWNGFDGISDGWTSDNDGVKVLRVPAGRTLTVGYEPFEAFKTNPTASMSLEIEFAIRNITAEDEPVINVSQTIASTLENLGLIIKPLSGAIWAQEKQAEDDQDFAFEEDTRVHLTLTLTPALIAKSSDEFTWQTPNGTPTNRPTAKIYINGKPQRAIQYSVESKGVWIQGEGHGGIRLGNPSCDLDIYFIRCYRGTTLSAQNVIQNFTATRPDAVTKNTIRKRNDVLDGNGRISYDKVKAKGKRCLTLVGTDNYKINQDKETGYACFWKIDYFDDNGNAIPELSGTIGKAAYEAYVAGKCTIKECLRNTAQGSTANTYWWNNEQTKLDKVTYVKRILFSTLHADFGWKASLSNFDDTTAAKNPLWLDDTQVQGDAVADMTEAQLARLQIDVIDGWVDGNGMHHGQFYTPVLGGPKATKLVNKINYASPMQSHKMGTTKLFNDVMKEVCSSELPSWFAGDQARFAVYEDEYFFFNQPEGFSDPIFIGFCTFGSGKCDKPTWGYSKKQMFAFEGLNNNLPLCDFRVPADENVTYNVEDEAWGYNGSKSFELSLGATNSDDTPTDKVDSLFRRICNFIYAHDTRIKYYAGSRSDFDSYFKEVYAAATQEGASEEATQLLGTMQTTKYWLRDGSEAFHLLRYDFISSSFVDAGTWTVTGGYAAGVRNLATDAMTKAAYDAWNASTDSGDYNVLNEKFRMAIAADFDKNIGKFGVKSNWMTHYNLINFMLAGTDNCSKNTYYTVDMTTQLCWLYQDDTDTILSTDNNGRQTKVYFLSRYFDVADTEAGLKNQKDYEGTASALFNTIEAAWEENDPSALPGNMQTILTTMSKLVNANDPIGDLTETQRYTPMGCIYKYFFSVQNYFPEVAWAEQQRIRYDWPASWGYTSSGNQARSILAVTQGIGDQTERERSYITRRLAMICSYAAWGEFVGDATSGTSGLTDAAATFSLSPGQGRKGGEYTFDLVPHQFIYPCGVRDRTKVNPHKRVVPGEHYSLTVATAGNSVEGDSSITLAAINYYRSIGNVGNMVAGNKNVTVLGKRLTDFTAEPTNGGTAFQPTQVDITATNLKRFSLKGVSTLTGTINLTAATRLQSLDLRGTKYGTVRLPQSPQLSSVLLGDNVSSFEVKNLLALTELTFDGYSKLAELTFSNCNPALDVKSIVAGCRSESAPLTTFKAENVAWTDCASGILSYLVTVADCSLTGTIAVSSTSAVDSTLKLALLQHFGNIDSKDNALYITYTARSLTGIGITNARFTITEPGTYAYDFAVTPASANNFSTVEWSLSKNACGATVNPTTGTVTVPKVGDEESGPTATLTATATLTNGERVSSSVTLKLYNRLPKLGDFAYYNGEFDQVLYPNKTVVGWVYKVTPYVDLDESLRNEYLKDPTIAAAYNSGKTLYEVLVDNTSELSITDSDAGNTFSSLVWGIYPANDTNGISDTERQAIADALGITKANVSDIEDIVNCTTSGLKNSAGTSTSDTSIRDYNAYDDTTTDGFPVWEGNVGANRWNGKKDTASIVTHAKNVLTKYVAAGLLVDSSGNDIYHYLPAGRDHVVPKTLAELADLYVALAKVGGADRWRQLCFPAAFACTLYEPTVNKKAIDGLSPWYARGQWYLPGGGDTVRLYTFFRNSRGLTPQDTGTPTADYSDEDNTSRPQEPTDARRPFYANLMKRAKSSGLQCPVNNPVQGGRWTATEYNSSNAWGSNFGYGYFGPNYHKNGSMSVRPVAAFPFIL